MGEDDGVDPSIAELYGTRWSVGAAVRAEHYAEMSRPAWEKVADEVGVGPGTHVLDVACGSGEFARLAAARGAVPAGIDASTAMIELATGLVPDADLRVGTLEELPWDDGEFDVVTGFNAFQFAPDIVAALAEARRVARRAVAICNWGPDGEQELMAVTHAAQALVSGPRLVAERALGEPGVLEGLARDAGLEPGPAGGIEVPYAPPDRSTLERALLSAGNIRPVVDQVGPGAVRRAVVDAAAPYRKADGSYLFRNTFRYLITAVPAQRVRRPVSPPE